MDLVLAFASLTDASEEAFPVNMSRFRYEIALKIKARPIFHGENGKGESIHDR